MKPGVLFFDPKDSLREALNVFIQARAVDWDLFFVTDLSQATEFAAHPSVHAVVAEAGPGILDLLEAAPNKPSAVVGEGAESDAFDAAFDWEDLAENLDEFLAGSFAPSGMPTYADLQRKLFLTQAEFAWRLAMAAEDRDQEHANHPIRVACTAKILARTLGLSEQYQDTIGLAAMLHDVGKLTIPKSILRKKGKLTEEELAIIRTHCLNGHEILSTPFPGSPDVEDERDNESVLAMARVIALQHHERWDGAGYPSQLKGEEIDLAARIVAVADVFDVLRCERPYKQAFPEDQAIDMIRDESGKQFDAAVVGALLESLPEVRQLIFSLADPVRSNAA